MLQELQNIFNSTLSVSYSFFKIMEQSFTFYSEISEDFYSKMPDLIAENQVQEYLLNTLSPLLFQEEYCHNIKNKQKLLLSELASLEQFLASTTLPYEKVNNLPLLKQIADLMYDLLHTHTQLYFQYQNQQVNKKDLVFFIIQIDQIRTLWTSYADRYSAIKNVLMPNMIQHIEQDQTCFSFYYLPTITEYTFIILDVQSIIEIIEKFHSFLQALQPDETLDKPFIQQLQISETLSCSLIIPKNTLQSYKYFFKYLSLDNMKLDVLVKQLLEMIAKTRQASMTKPKLTSYVKQFVKLLSNLTDKGAFTVNQEKLQDHILHFSSFIQELDKLDITHENARVSKSKAKTKEIAENNQSSQTDSLVANPNVVKKDETKPDKKDIQFLTS